MNDKVYLYIFLISWIGLILAAVVGFVVLQYDSSSQHDIDAGVEFSGEAVEEEELSFTLTRDSDPVEGAAVELDGESIGNTDEEGEISYVPEVSGQKIIRFETDDFEVSETFEVSEGESEQESESDQEEDESEDEDEETENGDQDEEDGSTEDGSEDEDEETENGDQDEEDGSTEDGSEDEDEETENGDQDEEDNQDSQDLEAQITYTPENPSTGDEVTLNAESSSGNIENYTWSSPDIELDEGSGESITQEFQNSGLFTIELEVENAVGDTNLTTVELDVHDIDESEPQIQLNEPSEGEYQETEIIYEFEIKDGREGAEYRIIIDGETNETGQLSENGTQEFEKTVALDEGNYDTLVELEQQESIYQTEEITIEVELEEETVEPQFTLDSPEDGETIETFEDETDVNFEFTVQDREWADEATIEIEETEDEYTRPISSEQTYGNNFNPVLTAESEGKSYKWIVTMSDGEREINKTRYFNVQKTEPENEVSIEDIKVLDNGYATEINYTASSDLSRTVGLEIDGEIVRTSDERSSPFDMSYSHVEVSEKTGEHTARALILEIDSDTLIDKSDEEIFETTEEPPENGGETE